MPITIKHCLTCKYFKHDAREERAGVCRRYPPIQHHESSSGLLTRVGRIDVCGEYAKGDPL